ncbi:MAG: dUTP diphosphatase [Bacilli bacterium]|nr:dUTP diphosphatase [Bacilli bacterium]
MICVLKEMYQKQLELDTEIAKNHNISYEETKDKRLLALLVELGEFANATRTFKFWSFKPSESKERVLDEFADGLHFLLSLGLAYHFEVDSIEVEGSELDLTSAILNSYHYINEFYNERSFVKYCKMFEGYLKILATLGYSWSDAYGAYFLKLEENHHRQETNY